MQSHSESKRSPVEPDPSGTKPVDLDGQRNDEIWLSTEDVARRLKIRPKTLAAWAAARRGPRFARMGRYRRYRLADLLCWEQNQLDQGGGSSDSAGQSNSP
ncbi:helix-turn-helix domain-containing protein [Nocardia suismassiliense]|uniref:Helix-turn-helix domain-containing protein n=1 Tax=Nocardia suismassiliense TaxID=2077092 RepID=A0ABW6R384_9NOCA